MTELIWKHVIPDVIVALATGNMLKVWRTCRLETDCVGYQPAAEYVREHGYVLTESLRQETDPHIEGPLIVEWFTSPADRQALYAYPAPAVAE